ncbi:eukaryotic translation initiation factor 3 subunit A-like [Andrographis paniculata]|uniref:eukaryotic translation initiation factor 3 subunit A-like n=1 Tax=Andrographis paniculata TaxID=175694 RepID=UPI0021E71482|nr:eukaryotic translation initiation factor 3 subunit A-like [Andrographis paniculata]XP_051124068.1 eukaryotic translation initiation factor 3 subunit A-like [Andrographis paniculata]
MAPFAKPENALKRAEELINVGQKQEALQSLHALLTSRRHRAWQKTLERIMFKYIELCVEMRRGRFAKEGLIQYRIVCQQVNVSSLEEVIKFFIHLSTERAEQGRNQAEALEDALDVDDLEAEKRPEDLMLSYVSGEKGKDRSDRELVTPWFKFLWETYRTVLEILRNNSKLEALYAMTAHRAFQFCKQYKRLTEFRRLCETIRNHLANLIKYRDQRDRPDLSVPESLQLYLDTRFEQLKVATELELWQEAFRSAEDIHGLMCIVKKQPKTSLMVVYYAKLIDIFWTSSGYLYHAYAWSRLFALLKSFNKNLTQKDLQLTASSAVLAALSVPLYDHTRGASHKELEHEKERSFRMSNLIGFILDPKTEGRDMLSRSSILTELFSKGVMACVTYEVKELYNLLENEFLPLDLASKVQPLLTRISTVKGKIASASSISEVRLSQYIPNIKKLAALRVLQQVSRVYQTLKSETLSQMIPFFESHVVEKILVDAVKQNYASMKVNYVKGAIIVGNQDLESEGLRGQLMIFTESLNKARGMVYPAAVKESKLGEMLLHLNDTVEKEHKRLLARKLIIEKRKEEQERKLLEKERQEESERLKVQKLTEEAEQKRLAIEFEQMRAERIHREIEERELEEAQAMLQEAEKHGKRKGKKAIADREKVTKQSLMEHALNKQMKERMEAQKKLQKLSKSLDYLVRAMREEEAPLINAAYQKRMEEEKVLDEHLQQKEIELSRQRHEGDLKEKTRLQRMLDDKLAFQERAIQGRKDEHKRMKAEREKRFQKVILGWKQEREEKRKLVFYLRSEEERQRKLHEEEKARKREEEEKRKKEEMDRKAKLDEIAEKQRQRERELEERERQRREAILGRSSLSSSTDKDKENPLLLQPENGAAAAATTTGGGKYVPKFKQRLGMSPSSGKVEGDRWGSSSSSSQKASLQTDDGGNRWRSGSSSASRWTSSSYNKR